MSKQPGYSPPFNPISVDVNGEIHKGVYQDLGDSVRVISHTNGQGKTNQIGNSDPADVARRVLYHLVVDFGRPAAPPWR